MKLVLIFPPAMDCASLFPLGCVMVVPLPLILVISFGGTMCKHMYLNIGGILLPEHGKWKTRCSDCSFFNNVPGTSSTVFGRMFCSIHRYCLYVIDYIAMSKILRCQRCYPQVIDIVVFRPYMVSAGHRWYLQLIDTVCRSYMLIIVIDSVCRSYMVAR